MIHTVNEKFQQKIISLTLRGTQINKVTYKQILLLGLVSVLNPLLLILSLLNPDIIQLEMMQMITRLSMILIYFLTYKVLHLNIEQLRKYLHVLCGLLYSCSNPILFDTEIDELSLHKTLTFHYLTEATSLCFIMIRFKCKSYDVRIQGLVLFIVNLFVVGPSNIIGYLQFYLLCVIVSETVIWRNNFFKKEQLKIKNDINAETELLTEELQQKINEVTGQTTTSQNNVFVTRGQQIMTKLRLMKYQMLLRKSNNMRKRMSPRLFSGKSKKSPMLQSHDVSKKNISYKNHRNIIGSDDEEDTVKLKQERSPQTLKTNIQPFNSMTAIRRFTTQVNVDPYKLRQTLIMKDEIKEIDSLESVYSDNSSQTSNGNRKTSSFEKFSEQDIDDLIQICLGKADQLWLPEVLKNQKVGQKQDTTYLLENFTNIQSESKGFIHTELQFQRRNSGNYPDTMSPDKNFLHQQLQLSLGQYNVDFFALKEQHQNEWIFVEFGMQLFWKYNLFNQLHQKDSLDVGEFFVCIQKLYHNNPYHNYVHAVDVTNSIVFYLQNDFDDKINHFQKLCLLVSSMCHDVGHPGVNNNYLIQSKSQTAILYNDQSVLEHYHSSILFQVLLNKQSNILKNLDEQQSKSFRKNCISLILDTDLQKHFPILNKLKSLTAISSEIPNDEQEIMISTLLLKCADVGHGSKKLDLHKAWSRRIIEEFYLQGNKEVAKNLPLSPFCDHRTPIGQSQIGFLKVIVNPIFDIMDQYIKNPNIKQTCIQSIQDNIDYWETQRQQEENSRKCDFREETEYVKNQIQVELQNQGFQLDKILPLFAQLLQS